MLRLLRYALIGLLFAFLGGFVLFAERVTRLAAAIAEPPAADGVVALTGGGGARISTGMELLARGKGKRLLVSGVNPQTTDEDVRQLAGGEETLFSCCVDLGRSARSTIGNAHETAAWADDHGYRSLIIVTSDFHMPRSLIELQGAMRDVKLTAYPVGPAIETGRPWWRDPGVTRRIAVEYVKFLVIFARERARDLFAPPPPRRAFRDAAKDEPESGTAP